MASLIAVFWGFWGFHLRDRNRLSPVEISAWMALSAGLVLPRLLPQGDLLALIATCVSYTVMSDRGRIANQLQMLFVSLSCSFLIYGGQALLVGVGGRLGSAAALTVLVFSGIQYLLGRGASGA